MNSSKRLVLVGFLLLIILFGGLLFWPFVLNDIIRPVSLVVWILLRMFVLSIDQKYYWMVVIFMTAFFLYRRLLSLLPPMIQAGNSQNSNEIMRTIGHWRSLFTLTDQDILVGKTLKEELVRLVLSLEPTNQRTLPFYLLYDALQRGEISIPDQIHTFLFLAKPQKGGYSLKKLIQFIGHTFWKWIRRWTGQDFADQCRMIDEILCFMETSLEMNNDDGKFNPNKH